MNYNDDNLDEFCDLIGSENEDTVNVRNYDLRSNCIHPSRFRMHETLKLRPDRVIEDMRHQYYFYENAWIVLHMKVNATGPDGGWDELRIDSLGRLEEWFQGINSREFWK